MFRNPVFLNTIVPHIPSRASLHAALLFAASTALGMATATPLVAAQLDDTEQRLVAAVKAGNDEALLELERAVNINSGTMNHEGVREVGAHYRTAFEAIGFSTRWAEMPKDMQRAGHLIAEHKGTQGKRLLLIGHLDTVFEKNSPVQKWERRGDRVRGQGVSDMKGGNTVILAALRALKSVGALDNTQIAVVFSGDEEDAGDPITVSRADLREIAKRSDLALAFEATVLDKNGHATGTIGRRSSSGFTLEVTGKQGHSSGVFGGNGFGAIYEAARILNAFREQVIEPDLTFNAAFVLGGTELSYDEQHSRGTAFGKTNVIPKTTLVKGDMRYITSEQGERAREKMRAIVAQNLKGTSASIRFEESYPPMAPTPGNVKLLELYSRASEDLGLGKVAAVPPGSRGAGDIQFVSPFVDSLDGLGTTGRGAHSPDEDLEIASVERATLRTALLIYRLTR